MYRIAEYLSYTFRCIQIALKIIKAGFNSDLLFRFAKDCRCVNLFAISGKLAHEYYNLLLPRITLKKNSNKNYRASPISLSHFHFPFYFILYTI